MKTGLIAQQEAVGKAGTAGTAAHVTYQEDACDIFEGLGAGRVVHQARDIALYFRGLQRLRYVAHVNIAQHQVLLLAIHMHCIDSALRVALQFRRPDVLPTERKHKPLYVLSQYIPHSSL